MKLSQKRVLFTRLMSKFLAWAIDNGYEIAFDREHCDHMENSLHYLGLAKDFVMYRDGKYLQDTEDYRFLGDLWKSFNPLCCWGGDFRNKDGCHFSMAHGGRK